MSSTQDTAQPITPEIKTIPETLTEQEALTVLINAVHLGQKAGVYTIPEAELISKAIRTFTVVPGPSPSSS